jgi:hypothetical protein
MAAGKEVHLFDAEDFSSQWTSEEISARYAPYFTNANENSLWGEATPIYLYWPPIIAALKRYNPALKIIVILRDPAARAISHYEMEKGRGNESKPLWLALACEQKRLMLEGEHLGYAHRCHSYQDRGRYAEQLESLRSHFADEQILVLESESLKLEHDTTLKKVCDFLGVAPDHVIKAERVFSGSYQKPHLSLYYALVKFYLKWSFKKSNAKLKSILLDMGISTDWRWLK